MVDGMKPRLQTEYDKPVKCDCGSDMVYTGASPDKGEHYVCRKCGKMAYSHYESRP